MIDFGQLTALAARENIERIGDGDGIGVRDAPGRIPRIRRSPHDVLPGRWEHPGGGREHGEAMLAGAAGPSSGRTA
ncbi:hypothetical protein ACIQ9P_08800 [Kitasatospora sp. NPDC094019]|uniref:hypothetical protein n=1 Tax=Kitasatospora sp. NPDC094019 TaxID=3364091 RepID=UPI00381CD901